MVINKKKMIKIMVFLLLVCINIYLYRFELWKIIYDCFDKDKITVELTTEQKVEDFESFYNTIVESTPYLKQKKKLYGIDFVSRKNYYLEEVKNTSNNLEYLGVMKAIASDISSFHTDICFPMYSHLQGLNCYNSEKVINSPRRKEKVEAWWSEIEKGIRDYEDVNLIKVVYVDGKYIVENSCLPHDFSELENYELDQIDNVDAREYIVEHLSIFKLQYDYLYNQAYRTGFVLNDKIGKKVDVVWKSKDGEKQHETMYINNGAEIVWSFGYLFSDKYDYYNMADYEEEDVLMHRDNENQLEYIKINNFDNDKGDELKEYLLNTPYKKIIIDLRENYGGLNKYAVKYLYPGLYHEDNTFTYSWKIPNTKENKKMSNSLGVRLFYYEQKDDNYIYYKDTLKFKGEQTDNKEVYYLTSPFTGSAADTYVAMIKEKKLGKLVGTNTGGEGLGASFICDALNNSSLIYVYYPSIATDDLGNEHEDAGVAPDIYVDQSREDYNEEQITNDSSDYIQKIKYDTVLRWVLEK